MTTPSGRVEAVLPDFSHPSGHLGDRAEGWHGPGTEAAEAEHQRWPHRRKREGGAAVRAAPRAPAGGSRPSAREVWRATVTCFEGRVHRMGSWAGG